MDWSQEDGLSSENNFTDNFPYLCEKTGTIQDLQ